VDCRCNAAEASDRLQKIENEILDMTDTAKRLLRVASDPVSAMIKFLHDRPEHVSLAGGSMRQVLLESFGTCEQVPGLLRLLSGHVREIVRHANVIDVHNEHLFQEMWAGYLIKLKEKIKFEVGFERDRIVLKNIHGLVCVEQGMELPLERILVNPPKLEITVRLGLLRPVRALDIA